MIAIEANEKYEIPKGEETLLSATLHSMTKQWKRKHEKEKKNPPKIALRFWEGKRTKTMCLLKRKNSFMSLEEEKKHIQHLLLQHAMSIFMKLTGNYRQAFETARIGLHSS